MNKWKRQKTYRSGLDGAEVGPIVLPKITPRRLTPTANDFTGMSEACAIMCVY